MTLRRYAVVIEPTSIGFSAYSLEVPACAAVCDTVEEACNNFREALEFHFGGMRVVGEPIPEPTSDAVKVQVRSA